MCHRSAHTTRLLALPLDMPAEHTKSVITLDSWFNRLWQHWKVVNEIAFFICISVFADKSAQEQHIWHWIKRPWSRCVFSEGITTLISNSVRNRICPSGQRCPGPILCAVVTVEGSWEGWGSHFVPVSHTRGREKGCCQTTCQPLMLQRMEELN